jgi:hypothetical protein
MVKERERVTIEIDPNSELARALRAGNDRDIVLISDGDRYEVVRVARGAADDEDAEAFREALRAAVGIFTPEEAEQLKQDIYRWREEGTRPIARSGRNSQH